MKICLLSSDHTASDGRLFHKEAVSLRKKYPAVCVLAPDDGPCGTRMGIRIIALPRPRGPLGVLKMLLAMPRIGAATRSDVYHCFEPESLWVAGRITRGGRAKLVYDAHEYFPQQFAEKFPPRLRPSVAWALRLGERLLSRNADYVITVCPELAEKFEAWGHRVALVENLALEADEPQPEPGAPRAAGTALGVYVGGLYRKKGILETIEAAAIARRRGTAVNLLFLGPARGRFLEEAQACAARLGMEDQVQFLGRVPFESLEGHLRRADFGVVMNHPEARHLNAPAVKLFEYMKAGLPVIANDLPAMARIVRDADCGLLADPLRPESIADAMVALLADQDRMRTMGQNGRRAWQQRFTWKQAEHRLLQVYDHLERQV